jgi:membrane protein
MILGIAFLLTVSLVLSAAIAALGRWWGAAEVLAHVLELALSFGLTTVLFALIYRFIPRASVAWRDVWIGAAVTAILFAVGKLLIGLYLGGAEFTWVYAHEYGSRRGQPRPGMEPASTVPAPAPNMPRPAPRLPAPAAPTVWRQRHPFGGLGIAFVAGVTIGTAKSIGEHLLARKWSST